jgi:hypothetical protein
MWPDVSPGEALDRLLGFDVLLHGGEDHSERRDAARAIEE